MKGKRGRRRAGEGVSGRVTSVNSSPPSADDINRNFKRLQVAAASNVAVAVVAACHRVLHLQLQPLVACGHNCFTTPVAAARGRCLGAFRAV